MKQLNKPLSKEYPPVKIFLEDLESIEKLLLKPKSGFRVETEELEFGNIKELKQKYQNETKRNLKILSNNPYVSIEFQKMWARLYVGSENNSEAGLFYKLDRIISSSTRRPSFLYSYYTLCIGYLIFPVVQFLSRGLVSQIISISNYIFFVWVFWALYIRLSKHSEIILSKRHDIQSFLTRNKDQLIVTLFSVSVGAVLGVVGTVITYKMGFLNQ